MKRGRKPTVTQLINDVKRQTRRRYSSEEKIKIVLEGLRGETLTFRPFGELLMKNQFSRIKIT